MTENKEAFATRTNAGDNTTITTSATSTSSTSQTGDARKAGGDINTNSKTGDTTKTGGEKKKRHLQLVKDNPDLEYVKEKAKEFYRKNGKWPGRPTLQRIAGCRENHARNALRELKGAS